MTDEAPATATAPSAAPAATAAPPAQQAAPPTAPTTEQPPAYKIPDAYKDKPWASKVKSEDDVWKQLDNAQSLLGKKVLPPIDFKTATPQEIEEHFTAYRPSDKTAYQFGEGADAQFVDGVAGILYESGVSEYQANKLIPAYQALEMRRMEEATSADGFKAVMTESFGEKYDAVVANAESVFKSSLSDKGKAVLDIMPNQFLQPMYELAEAHRKQIAELKKQYGVEENGDAHVKSTGGVQTVDVTKTRSDIRAKIAEMDLRPHTADDKQKLIDELHATYRKAK